VSVYLVGTYALNVMSELCPRGLRVEIIFGRESVGLVRKCKRYMHLVRQCARFIQPVRQCKMFKQLERLIDITELYSVTFQKTSV